MTFVDPDTNLLIDCSVCEYEQMKGHFIKTKYVTSFEEENEANF